MKGLHGRATQGKPHVANMTEAMQRLAMEKIVYSQGTDGVVFDDLAWRLLKKHVPKYCMESMMDHHWQVFISQR